ncbi:MAG: hypothetical protein MZW92_42080 [Comamonadaceae bacterium]|nr:hypothetical protein [Comamonadaceae bacterium]
MLAWRARLALAQPARCRGRWLRAGAAGCWPPALTLLERTHAARQGGRRHAAGGADGAEDAGAARAARRAAWCSSSASSSC